MDVISWMAGHVDELMAIVGAAYVLARLVVALTPTNADDRALEKAHMALRVLAAAFGLNLTQGINKAPVTGIRKIR